MKSIKTLTPAALLWAAGVLSNPAIAQVAMERADAGGVKLAHAGSEPMTEGEVRKIDKDNGKLTLKHREIKNLDMPAMTMVFIVKDRTLLDRVRAGDKVRFRAEKLDGAFTVTAIEAAK